MAGSPLKIAYLSGPANLRQIYREWSGDTQQAYVGTDYMKQFLQLANSVGAEAHIVTWHGDDRETYRLGEFTVDNRPITSRTGLRYYADQLFWHLKLLVDLLRIRPRVLLLTGNQDFWWVLSPLLLTGTRVIVSYHAVLWPKFMPRRFAQRVMTWLNGLLILRHASAILVTSKDIGRQLREVLGSRTERVDILEHLPTYSPQQFADIGAPSAPSDRPFRVLFLGRIVENKGIYDIVEIARQIEKDSPGTIRFDICGAGAELERLRDQIQRMDLTDAVHCHGFCGQAEVRPLLQAAHACIVPTRTDCEAGFEMTCSESILAGRPLITSRVCPALEYLEEASVEASPDDPASYRQAIAHLSGDAVLYERKRKACASLQEQFYDPGNSWYAAMQAALARHILPASKGAEQRGQKNEIPADTGG